MDPENTHGNGKVGHIWTIGHSTHSEDEFWALLKTHGLRVLADIRRYPGSRRYPYFASEAMQGRAVTEGIEYLWMPELGGRRKALPDSQNTAWRSEQFRGYADYMETAAFNTAMEQLKSFARKAPTVMMCSEAVWWRCHRGLVADRLKAEGWQVDHILSATKLQAHPYTSAARIVDGQLTYGLVVGTE